MISMLAFPNAEDQNQIEIGSGEDGLRYVKICRIAPSVPFEVEKVEKLGVEPQECANPHGNIPNLGYVVWYVENPLVLGMFRAINGK